jgi:hypothetical protein
MQDNWVLVFSSAHLHQVEIIREVLLDNAIIASIFNKQDSMHKHLNYFQPIELYVKKEDAFDAKQIINKINFEHNN